MKTLNGTLSYRLRIAIPPETEATVRLIDVSRADAGFGSDRNAVVFVWPGGEVEELPLLPKTEVAGQLWDRVEKLRAGR